MKKLPKWASEPNRASLGFFFHDFFCCRHAKAKIPTVLESAHQARSNDTHIAYIYDGEKFRAQRGTLGFFDMSRCQSNP